RSPSAPTYAPPTRLSCACAGAPRSSPSPAGRNRETAKRKLYSREVHLPQEPREPGVRAEGHEQERALDAVHATGSLLIGPLQRIQRKLPFAEAGVEVGQVVG